MNTTSPLLLANFNTFNPKTSLHFAETYVFRPKQLAQFGELFVVLQIDHATKTSPQIGDAVATILNHEYFRGNPSNVVQNLEDALHKTNEILSDLAARGEIHWIGKLHGVLGVFQKDSIHLSATGRGKAYLVRDGEIAEVTSGLYDSSRAASPMKTFENLASGELREGDTVILTTPGVTDYVTPESLRNILEANEPSEAVKTLQTRVSHDAASANASVVFRYSKSAAAPKPAALSVSPIIAPTPARVPARRTSAPKASTFVKPTEPLATVPSSSTTPDATSKGSRFGFLKKLPKIKMPKLRRKGVRAAAPATSGATQTVPSPTATNGSPKAKTSPVAKVKRAIIRMPAKAKVFTALALVLVLVFVVSLFIFTGARGSRAAREELTAKLEQAKKAEQEAAAAIIFKDSTQAQNLLKQAESLIAELEGTKDFEQDLATLKTSIAQDYEKISGSVRINEPTKLAQLGGNPLGLALVEGELVAWLENGKIEVISLKDGDTATGADLESDLGVPSVGAVDENRLVLATDEAKLVGFEDGDASELEVGGTFEPEQLIALESYGSRLYTLDPAADKINRHQRTIAGYGQGTSWILDGTSVSDGIDLAVDGSIFVLLRNGTITKFLQGTKEDYTLGPVVDPLEQPTKIVTGEDMSSLYILEPKKHRLLQFDKEKGDFTKQFVSDTFTDLRDVVIIEKGARAYVLNGDTVYQLDLNK